MFDLNSPGAATLVAAIPTLLGTLLSGFQLNVQSL